MGGELCGLRANGGARMLVTMQQQSSPGCGVLLPRCCRSAELTATERQRKKKIWEHGEHVVRKLWMQLWAGRTQYQHSCTSRRKGKKMGHVQSFKQCTVWRATPQKIWHCRLPRQCKQSWPLQKRQQRVSQMCLTWHQNATYPKVTSFMKGHITPELNHRLMWSEGLHNCPWTC